MNMDRSTVGLTPMGGEGAQWVGLAPFTEVDHLYQNLGDGTFTHSGSLAIRQAVAAGAHVTFKILYNGTVAMTGGQDAPGALPVPELTRLLEAEGVRRVLVVADDPDKYPRHARWAEGVEVWGRERLDEAQRALRAVGGVTALIYDQYCAAEKRRLRKRGKMVDPARRVFINEAVCEGCGDCGAKSNCLSVHPVDTELGRKTQIHQSSCNKDYSCLEGDCPSFVTVEPRGKRRRPAVLIDPRALPEPARAAREGQVFMAGVGGTGVVTVNQILATAALLDGRHVRGHDQTGLSQKGGPVVSHLKVAETPFEGSNKIAAGEADCYLGFDVLVAAAPAQLDRARSERTLAVVSTSQVPTGAMVASPQIRFPDPGGLRAGIDRVTRKDENVWLDAQAIAEALFGDHMMANLVTLGAAYQAGALPVTAEAIESAIELNGVAVGANVQAFRAGRRAVSEPAWVDSLRRERVGAVALSPATAVTAEARHLVNLVGAEGELLRLVELRVPELIAYQDEAYARQYAEAVARVAAAERAKVPGSSKLAEAVARHLFTLMAYKDEYEVARLHRKPDLLRALAEEYPEGFQLRYQLHPPLLRALGLKRKIGLGRWFEPVFDVLAAMRRLRGTALDPFGYAKVRRVERGLIREYRALLDRVLGDLSPATHARAVQVASLPGLVRGYEHIKLRNVERFHSEARRLLGGA
jgi:indolepyruvate ferredoxin oxidoreductase